MSISTLIQAVILFIYTGIFTAAVVILFFGERIGEAAATPWAVTFGLLVSLMISLFIYRLYQRYQIEGDILSSTAIGMALLMGIIGALVVVIAGLHVIYILVVVGIGQLVGVVLGVFWELSARAPDTISPFSLKNPALQNALALALLILGSFGLLGGLVAWQFPVEPVNQQAKEPQILSHTSPVEYVAVSPSGQLLVTASTEQVQLWRLEQCLPTSAQCQSQSFNPTENLLFIIGLAFSPDEQWLLVGSTAIVNSQVQIYPLESCLKQPQSCEAVYAFKKEELITAIAFSPSGDTAAMGNRFEHTIELRQIEDCYHAPESDTCGALRHTLKVEGDLRPMTFAPDGETLASVDDKTLRLWQVSDGSLQHRLELEGADTALLTQPAFTANGAIVAVAGCTYLYGKYCNVPRIWFWRTDNGQLLRYVDTEELAISLAFAPTGDILAAGLLNGQIALWDMEDVAAKLLTTLEGHQAGVTDLKFLPNGNTLVSGSADQTTRLWALE